MIIFEDLNMTIIQVDNIGPNDLVTIVENDSTIRSIFYYCDKQPSFIDTIVFFSLNNPNYTILKKTGNGWSKKFTIPDTFHEIDGISFVDRVEKYAGVLKNQIDMLLNDEEKECLITTNYKGDKKSIDDIEIIDDVALVFSNYIIWYDESSKQSIRQFFESHPDVNFIAFIITDPYCMETLPLYQIICVEKTKNNYLTFTIRVDHYPTTEKEKKEVVKMIKIKEEWVNKKKRNTSIEEKDGPISWEEYFMSLAILSSYRSKDPSTKVGACIINPNDNTILSLGYNGFPRGCDDNLFPWGKGNENEEDNKYPYVVHAELNAILNAHKDLRGSVLYTTLSPCKECTKAIIQAGIKEVIYLHEFGHDDIVRKKMFDHAGVFCRQYRNPNPKNKEITLRLY